MISHVKFQPTPFSLPEYENALGLLPRPSLNKQLQNSIRVKPKWTGPLAQAIWGFQPNPPNSYNWTQYLAAGSSASIQSHIRSGESSSHPSSSSSTPKKVRMRSSSIYRPPFTPQSYSQLIMWFSIDDSDWLLHFPGISHDARIPLPHEHFLMPHPASLCSTAHRNSQTRFNIHHRLPGPNITHEKNAITSQMCIDFQHPSHQSLIIFCLSHVILSHQAASSCAPTNNQPTFANNNFPINQRHPNFTTPILILCPQRMWSDNYNSQKLSCSKFLKSQSNFKVSRPKILSSPTGVPF